MGVHESVRGRLINVIAKGSGGRLVQKVMIWNQRAVTTCIRAICSTLRRRVFGDRPLVNTHKRFASRVSSELLSRWRNAGAVRVKKTKQKTWRISALRGTKIALAQYTKGVFVPSWAGGREKPACDSCRLGLGVEECGRDREARGLKTYRAKRCIHNMYKAEALLTLLKTSLRAIFFGVFFLQL